MDDAATPYIEPRSSADVGRERFRSSPDDVSFERRREDRQSGFPVAGHDDFGGRPTDAAP